MNGGQQPFMAPFCAAAQASSAQEMGANMRNTLLRHPWSVVINVIGWARRALPICIDTRPDQNRGYTGPIKSHLDAVTNAHAARKLLLAKV
jgi:hypothetical protein